MFQSVTFPDLSESIVMNKIEKVGVCFPSLPFCGYKPGKLKSLSIAQTTPNLDLIQCLIMRVAIRNSPKLRPTLWSFSVMRKQLCSVCIYFFLSFFTGLYLGTRFSHNVYKWAIFGSMVLFLCVTVHHSRTFLWWWLLLLSLFVFFLCVTVCHRRTFLWWWWIFDLFWRNDVIIAFGNLLLFVAYFHIASRVVVFDCPFCRLFKT